MKKNFRIIHAYALDKNYFAAIDEEMARLQPDEWGVIMDLDTMPLLPDFGHQIQEYINKYPDTGMFTSYASRCHYSCQRRKGADDMNTDILYHKQIADNCRRGLHLKVKELNRKIAGHLMMIKKSTWLKIRDRVQKDAAGKKILGVDTKISYAILGLNLKIRLMRGVYLFHFLRLHKDYGYTQHLT
jgi:hypothetical protein